MIKYALDMKKQLFPFEERGCDKEELEYMGFNIAIDGPAGAGKSTIARRAAKELGFVYVDTGAMYRAMGLHILRNQIPREDEQAVAKACQDVKVSIAYESGEQQVYLNGENVSGEIRREEVGNVTSVISAYPKVREKLLHLQRYLAEKEDVIMDGRDIGTCVLPHAPLKLYLTASVRTRANRRYQELTLKGMDCDLEAICEDIAARDQRDMNRAVSPLRQAEDAVLLESSELGIEEVTSLVVGYAKERMRKGQE